MASVSYSVTNAGDDAILTVTPATSAPGAGDLEVRIDLTKSWTKRSIETAMDRIYRYVLDTNSGPDE